MYHITTLQIPFFNPQNNDSYQMIANSTSSQRSHWVKVATINFNLSSLCLYTVPKLGQCIFFLNQFVQMKNYHKAVVLKVWVRVSETLQEVPEILSGDFWGLFRGSMGSNYFHNKILFSFSFLFYHEYSLEFSKVYMTCDDIIAVTASWIYACVLLCFKIYQFSFQIQ